LYCVRKQRENCCDGVNLYAEAPQENRSFKCPLHPPFSQLLHPLGVGCDPEHNGEGDIF
jgi:hypothetical protein